MAETAETLDPPKKVPYIQLIPNKESDEVLNLLEGSLTDKTRLLMDPDSMVALPPLAVKVPQIRLLNQLLPPWFWKFP